MRGAREVRSAGVAALRRAPERPSNEADGRLSAADPSAGEAPLVLVRFDLLGRGRGLLFRRRDDEVVLVLQHQVIERRVLLEGVRAGGLLEECLPRVLRPG